jgi:hypothetical protein
MVMMVLSKSGMEAPIGILLCNLVQMHSDTSKHIHDLSISAKPWTYVKVQSSSYPEPVTGPQVQFRKVQVWTKVLNWTPAALLACNTYSMPKLVVSLLSLITKICDINMPPL